MYDTFMHIIMNTTNQQSGKAHFRFSSENIKININYIVSSPPLALNVRRYERTNKENFNSLVCQLSQEIIFYFKNNFRSFSNNFQLTSALPVMTLYKKKQDEQHKLKLYNFWSSSSYNKHLKKKVQLRTDKIW